MATETDREIARLFLDYYSGRIQGIAKDDTKINSFIWSDEASKITQLKTFVTNIIKPMTEANKASLTNSIADIDSKIIELTTYIK